MKIRRVLLLVIACTLGPWMLWSGTRDYQNNQRLVSEGKEAQAQVLDHVIRTGSRGGDRYYLIVRFPTDTGEARKGRVQVNKTEYQRAVSGGTVLLHYLPANPLVCAVGEPVANWRSKWIGGGFLIFSGCLVVVLSQVRFSTRKGAEKIAGHVSALCEPRYEYAPANPRDFTHLDLSWYDEGQQWLAERGFCLLGDEENLTFKRTSKGNRTLLRTFLGRDGTTLAYLYHFQPTGGARMLGGSGFKILELQTHFVSGAFICTSNAEAAGKLDSPPGVDALRFPANTPREAILAGHEQRVSAFLARHPGIAAGRMSNLEDVHRVQNILQEMKATYRRNTGISREELQRLAGDRLRPEQIAALHAEVAKLHSGREQKAA